MSVGAVNKQTGDRIPTAGMPAIDNALSAISTNPVQNAIITAALAGKQATLTFDDAPTDGSNNPVKSNGIYDALATKQDATDNSLDTTAKTIVGAINEHEGDVSSLKSGLTNYEATTNSALDLPENTGKNLIPLSVATLKAINTSGTWNDNAYTFNGVTFTVQTDANDNIIGIKATGTATGGASYLLLVAASSTNPFTTKMLGRTVILNGCPAGGSESTYKINIYYAGQTNVVDTGIGATKTYPTTADSNNIALNVSNGYEIATGGIMFYPMLRMADITDPTFAPYIPSVERRIEAVESVAPTTIISVTADGVKTYAEILESMRPYSTLNCTLTVDNDVYQQMGVKKFANISITSNSGNTRITTIQMASNANKAFQTEIKSDGTSTVTEITQTVPTSGMVFSLIKYF